MGVDPVSAAERLDLGQRELGGLRQANALLRPAKANEGLELGPPREREASVSTRGAAPAEILLDDGDVARGLALFQEESGPEPDVAASGDRHVGAEVGCERGLSLRYERSLE